MSNIHPYTKYNPINHEVLVERDCFIGTFRVVKGDPSKTVLKIANAEEIDIRFVGFLKRKSDLHNGERMLPKPFLVDTDGNVLEAGDHVLLLKTTSDLAPYVCIGAISSVFNNSTDYKVNEDTETEVIYRNNDYRAFYVEMNKNGYLEVNLQGKTNDNANVLFNLQSENVENGRLTLNLSKDLLINTNKIYLGSETEEQPAILGNKMLEYLQRILTTLTLSSNILTTTGTGQFAPNVISELTTIKNELEQTLSKKVYLE